MKKITLTYLLLLVVVKLSAQQQSMFGHYFINPLLYNPAISGSTGHSQLFVLNRDQWKEFDGPQVKLLTADHLFSGRKVGAGLIVSDQKNGIQQVSKIKGNYTYHLKLSDENTLMFGLAAGVSISKVNFSNIIADRFDDPMLANPTEKSVSPGFDGGIAFKGSRFKTGIGLLQLEGSSLVKNVLPASRRSLVFSADYNFQLDEDSVFVLTPTLVARGAAGNPFYYDLNVTASWKGILWLGAGYKNGYAAQLDAGVRIKNIHLGYSYELPVGKVQDYVPGSNEITLGYVFTSYKQSKQKGSSGVKQSKEPKAKAPVKKQEDGLKAARQKELQLLMDQLSEREEHLIKHEQEIYNLIDSLYTKAGQKETKTNEEELERVAKTQREVNRIKEELKQFTKEKNVELFKLRQRIDALRREIDAME
jgi:type IX secretion system PorP/SprF family membrane protein